MVQNKINELRKAKGLTQRQLADAIGTSQQQIQRIEAGVQKPRADLAAGIAAVLEAPVSKVFPSLRKVKDPRDLLKVDAKDLEEAGIETDFSLQTLRVQLRNGSMLFFPISSQEQERIRRNFAQSSGNEFVVFDSMHERVALNLGRVNFAQFLFDPGVTEFAKVSERDGFAFYMGHGGDPIIFDVDCEDDAEEMVDSDSVENIGQVFYELETLLPDEDDAINFIDQDGEEVWIRPSQIAICKIPLWYVSSKLRDAESEGEEEDAKAGIETEAAPPIA